MKKRMVSVLLAGALIAQTVLLGACGNGAAGADAQAPGADNSENGGIAEENRDAAAREGSGGSAADGTENAGLPEETEKADIRDGKEAELAELGAGIRHEDGANGFAFRFTKGMLTQKGAGENMAVSPWSVWLSVAALVNATDEEAKDELLAALGRYGVDAETLNAEVKNAVYGLTNEERVAWMKENGQEYESPLKIANALFVEENTRVNSDFETVFAESYQGKLFFVDFADESCVQKVNDWAKEQTAGKIEHIIDTFKPGTVAAIANAIYFSDGWAQKFPEENTRNDVFAGAAGEEDVPFMYNEFLEMPYYEDETMQAASLRTAHGGRLTILLPGEGKSAEEILAEMDTEYFEKLDGAAERTVQLSLPKFRLESDVFSVKEVLELLGVPLTDGQKPHLTGVLEEEALFLSEAVQKAMIEVDEEGMTAAAVTVAAMMRMSMPVRQEPVVMKCDRPFAFLLTAHDGKGQQVLFTGVVNRIN